MSLGVASLVLLVVFIVNGLAASADAASLGFKNNSGGISEEHCLEITPAGWTFIIWGVIYAWQALWILYGWSFVLRPSFPRSIVFLTYIFFTVANLFNIMWTYLWGNDYAQVSYPIIALMSISLYSTIFVQALWLYRVTGTLKMQKRYLFDLYITRFLVLNGILIYAAWLTAATELNFAILLQDYAGVDSQAASTVALSILTVMIVVYFILENTILDRFLRFVFIVYPVLIWALSGILAAHWVHENDICAKDPQVVPTPTSLLVFSFLPLFCLLLGLFCGLFLDCLDHCQKVRLPMQLLPRRR